jgi:hypothetical protein
MIADNSLVMSGLLHSLQCQKDVPSNKAVSPQVFKKFFSGTFNRLVTLQVFQLFAIAAGR